MTTAMLVSLLILGLLAGGASGILGIGGGIIVIPVLIFLLHFGYKQAVGTSLAMMLPPIGVFAFLSYYRAGHVDLRAALTLAATFSIGALASAWMVNHFAVPDQILKRCFGLLLLYVAGRMLFDADPKAAASFRTFAVLLVGGITYAFMHLAGRRWERRLKADELYRRQRYRVAKGDYQI